MRKIQNQDELFICNGTISSHAPHGTSFATGFTSVLEDGEVALVNVTTNTIHNAAFPTSGFYKFVARNGDALLVSNIFDAATVTKTERAASTQTEQIDFLGYNADTNLGEIDSSSAKNEIFTLHMYIKGTSRTDFNQAFVKEGHYVTTAATTTAYTIATGLVTSLIANFSRFPNPMIRFERVCDEATETALTGTGTMTFVYGSNIVTCATDSDAVLVAGDYIRTVTGDGGLVYKVSSLVSSGSNQTLTLDVPWQGASGTIADSVAVAIKSGDMAAGTKWGLKLTGIEQPYSVQKYVNTLISWDAVFTKIDYNGKEATPTATVTNYQSPAYGSGTYAQVAEMERELQMGDGYQLYADIPAPTYRTQANSAKTYNLFHIKHLKNMTSHIGQEVPSLCGVTVAADAGLTYGSLAPVITATPTGSAGSGTLTVTIGGTPYHGVITFASDIDTTIDNWITSHATNLLALGVTAAANASTATFIRFTGTEGVSLEVGYTEGAVAGLSVAIADVAASGWLIWGSTDDAGSTL